MSGLFRSIRIPNGVTMLVANETVTVTGALGMISLQLNKDINISIVDKKEFFVLPCSKTLEQVTNDGVSKQEKTIIGTTRSVINNAIFGVTEGYVINMKLSGIGYKVALNTSKSTELIFEVGLAHKISFIVPDLIKCSLKGNEITLQGSDKHLVSWTADQLASLRIASDYSDKGVNYVSSNRIKYGHRNIKVLKKDKKK